MRLTASCLTLSNAAKQMSIGGNVKFRLEKLQAINFDPTFLRLFGDVRCTAG